MLLVGTSLGVAIISIKSREIICALPFGGILNDSKNKNVFGCVLSHLIFGQFDEKKGSLWLSGQTALVILVFCSDLKFVSPCKRSK